MKPSYGNWNNYEPSQFNTFSPIKYKSNVFCFSSVDFFMYLRGLIFILLSDRELHEGEYTDICSVMMLGFLMWIIIISGFHLFVMHC